MFPVISSGLQRVIEVYLSVSLRAWRNSILQQGIKIENKDAICLRYELSGPSRTLTFELCVTIRESCQCTLFVVRFYDICLYSSLLRINVAFYDRRYWSDTANLVLSSTFFSLPLSNLWSRRKNVHVSQHWLNRPGNELFHFAEQASHSVALLASSIQHKELSRSLSPNWRIKTISAFSQTQGE